MRTTLAQLRKHEACVDGYNKLVAHLQGVPYTPRKTYVRWKHDAPISLETILDSNGVLDAVWATRCLKGYDRELRHFAVACVRLLGPTDPRSLKALEVAEAFADGKTTKKELDEARDKAWDAADAAYTTAGYAAYTTAGYAAYAAATAYTTAGYAAYAAATAAYANPPKAVTDLFRTMVRNASCK